MSDGHELLTAYAGPEELQQALAQNQAEPLSLASADFDEDGVPDLVTGYGYQGRGIVSVLRGNVDAIYPNAPEAKQRKNSGSFTDAPFLSPAFLFSIPAAADFLGTGDFDGDSHWDVVTGSRDGDALSLLTGDGHGGFAAPQTIELPGRLSALVTGEINRADGLADVVVGVSTKDGPRVLVFEGPNGALKAKPEALSMPSVVNALALGQLDNSYEMDLAVGAGEQLLVVHGRDRKLSLDLEHQETVKAVEMETRSVGSSIRSLALGEFNRKHQPDIAVLTDAGQVEILSAPLQRDRKHRRAASLAAFELQRLTSQAWPQATMIVRSKISSLEGDDLVVLDPEQTQLVLLHAGVKPDATAPAAMAAGRAPIAILPLRLNVDALTDLVVLQHGQSAPSVLPTSPSQTFVVNSTADTNDGQCTTTANGCTLREAINAANANAGADTINFNIPGAAPYTISPTSKLPSTGTSLTIDGTTQPGFSGAPIIEINGTNAGMTDGFRLDGNANTIRGLVINRFARPGIADFGGNSGHIIEGNFIGLNVAGTAALPNGEAGVQLDGGNSTVGGTVAAARNVISGNNGPAVFLPDPLDVGNVVRGNFIGTDATGHVVLGGFGIHISSNGAMNNTVGGTTAQARNIISTGAGADVVETIGIDIGGKATGNLVQGNYVGTDVTGNNCLGNTVDGVFVDADSQINTIADDLITCNGRNGINIPQNSNPGVRINLDGDIIYQNGALGIDLGAPGITVNDPLDADGGANLQQNFPTLTSFGPSAAGGGEVSAKEHFAPNRPGIPASTDAAIIVSSQLSSAANTTYTVHWYFSAGSQCVTNQQGSRPLAYGRIPGITTDGSGNASFTFPFDFPVGMTSGNINTTATDPNGNTSEFSPCMAVNTAPPTATMQFSAAGYSVNEGGVSATINVTRSGDTSAASTVDFAASDGSATQNQDYVVTSGTLSFAAGETSKNFDVLIVNDAFVETAEAINLTLSNASGGTLGSQRTAMITITDNDTAGATSPAAKRYAAFLEGAQETPANNSPAKGTGYVLLNQSETAASVSLQFENQKLSSAETAAQIHGAGAAGAAAPALFTLPMSTPANTQINPTAQQVADLKAGLHYLNVHSNNFPNGEIRGQLLWNPTLEENFFVRQQYLDFLSRDGDPGGFGFWVNQVGSCGADAQCLHDRTITTSNAFFFEPEFQQTAGYVFRAYRAAFGNNQPFPNPDGSNLTEANKLIDYAAFVADRARVVGGADLATAQQAFANQFVARSAFTTKYVAATTAAQFVDAILANIQSADGANLTAQRQVLIDQYNNAGGGNAGRAMVLYRLADDNTQNPINNLAFINAEYNRQFALTLYFGYLRRNPDIGGFLFWQSQINLAPVRDVPKQNALVCSFLTAAEYQLRFGPQAPRSNAECPQ